MKTLKFPLVVEKFPIPSRRREASQHPDGSVDAARLEIDLQEAVRGEVRFDGATRGLYASDHSVYRQVPIGVVIPKDAQDVQDAVAVCRAHGAPILARGCGSSLAGQTCNVAVVLDFSKYMHELIEIDVENERARVQPGLINDHLRDPAVEKGLTFPADPATHAWATLGGAIGNNSCGSHSMTDPPGKTSDFVEELDILLYDGTRMRVGTTSEEELEQIIAAGGRRGEIYGKLRDLRDRYGDLIRERYPPLERRVSGFNLEQLLPENGFNVARALVGTEGTCAITLEATLRLVEHPPKRATVVLGYPDVFHAADHIIEIREHDPNALEAIDEHVPGNLRKKGQELEEISHLPDGGGWLFVEFGGQTQQDANEKAERLKAALEEHEDAPNIELFEDETEQEHIWAVREGAIGAARIPHELDTWPAWEDGTVPPEHLGEFLREFKELIDRHGLKVVLFGHFGQGCVHARTNNNLKTPEGIADFRSFMEECADLTVKYGGSLSGEHGEGQLRAELLPRMFGDELCRAFDEFKAIWDPDNKLNPRKVLSDSYKLDENLRLGVGYNPPRVQTHFSFIEDHGHFAGATERCFGFGKCRRTDGGTMCPSFMATREEKHSTRGRVRLLFEMLQGEAVTGGWRDEGVKDALDLCLACKGCKGDCPAAVDVATYKAEFLSHYYTGRVRPRAAYAMGLVMWWARLASLAPRLVNALASFPPTAELAKRAAGVATERELPHFATETFRSWFQHHQPARAHGSRVILWPDTFTNHFHPEVGKAAVEVLEHAGYRVELPVKPLCCGRPLYDYGMLSLAKRFLRQILDGMRAEIQAGIPLVVLEPSCGAVFRDELRNLLPNDEDAVRLSAQTYLLSEFLAEQAPHYRPPKLDAHAIVQGHCHHKSVFKLDSEREILDALGLDFEFLDTGCCGMAGSFGFEAGEKYDVSIKAGERALLPRVRDADAETIVIADGFSCREQIHQGTQRHALHLAQVIQLALHDEQRTDDGPYPEHRAQQLAEQSANGRTHARAIVAVGTTLATGALTRALRKR
ncbi:MAG: FAD-binding and (Fe-S)-binding domain-containing protein [Solirubrobacteraceae bacterium]